MADESNLFGGILGGIGAYQQYESIGDLQDTYAQTIGGLQETLPSNVQFKPFTVTSGLGTTNVAADGTTEQILSNQQQGLANQYSGLASNFAMQAGNMNPLFSGQASQLNQMGQNYTGSQYNPYSLSGQYGQQALGMGALGNYGQFQENAMASSAGAQNVGGMGAYGTNFRPDTISAYGFGSSQANALANRSYGLGMQGLAQAGQAGAGISGLQSQVQQQAQGMLGSLGGSTADREAEVYNRIRAMQTPEEQRQQLALDEKLAAQGRLGISTAQFGGTPEQLALSKAQEEAKNSAALQAMQQAQSEQQQAYGQATGLAGLSGQLAGQASDLQTAAQGRAQQLANMGMSAEQINSQLQSEGLSRGLQAGQYNRQGLLMQDQLTQSSFNRALQSGQFGREGQALASQLATQEQARNLQAMGFNRDTLSSNAALQQQAFNQALQSGQFGREGQQLASQLADAALQRDISQGMFGLQQAQGMQGLRSGDIQNQLALMGAAQQAMTGGANLQSLYGQLGSGMLGSSYLPYQQQLAMMQPALEAARYGQAGRETAANLQAQLALGGLGEQTKLEQIRGDLLRQGMMSVGQLGTAQIGSQGSTLNAILGGAIGGLGDAAWDKLTGLFSSGGGSAEEQLLAAIGAGGSGTPWWEGTASLGSGAYIPSDDPFADF